MHSLDKDRFEQLCEGLPWFLRKLIDMVISDIGIPALFPFHPRQVSAKKTVRGVLMIGYVSLVE